MMKPLLFYPLLLTMFFGYQSWASKPAASDCTDFHIRLGAFHFQRQVMNSGTCILSMDPFDITAFKYRGYLVSSDGIFMVFNSYSQAENSTATGARVFHFFPRQNTPDIIDLNQETHVQFAAPKIKLVLSQDKTQILRMIGATVKEDPKVQSSNKGGVEILKADTLYLDSGFALGHDVTTEPGRISTFYDINRKSCAVPNKELFVYSSQGDSDFRFSDAELKTFLKKRCPRLTVNF